MIFTKAILIIVVTVNRNINQSKSKYIDQIITQVINKSGHCTSGKIHYFEAHSVLWYKPKLNYIFSLYRECNRFLFVSTDINIWPHFFTIH